MGHECAQILSPEPELGIESRCRLELCWGASLYSTDFGPSVVSTYSSQLSSRFSFHDGLPWRSIASSVMTSMVVSLDICSVYKEILLGGRYKTWDRGQLNSLLMSLEASHWHARSFNENFGFRLNLHKQGFMAFRDKPSRLPHLLEQEVHSLSIIRDTMLLMYADCQGDSSDNASPAGLSFVVPWVER